MLRRWLGQVRLAPLLGLLSVWAVPTLAQPLTLKHPAASDGPSLCVDGRLDSARLADWYFFNNPDVATHFSSPAALQAGFAAAAPGGVAGAILADIAATLQAEIAAPNGFLRASAGLDGAGPGAGDEPGLQRFLSGQGGAPAITCAAAAPVAASSVAAPWLHHVRLRGTADALLIPRSTAGFAAASGSSLSLADNGATQTASTAEQVALGVDVAPPASQDGWQVDAVPFAAVNRAITTVNGQISASSIDNVSAGVAATAAVPVALPGGRVGAESASLTYAHVWNRISGAGLDYLHAIEQPVVNGVLNDAVFVPCCDVPAGGTWFTLTPLLDLRADAGFHGAAGNDLSDARNFLQFGGRFGAALAVAALHSNVVVTQTWLAQASHSRKDISLLDASWTCELAGPALSLRASYQTGNLEDTAQHVQQWLLALSAKY